jgi:phospholipase C
MAFLRDYNYVFDGDIVAFGTVKHVSAVSLSSNQGLLLKFTPLKGNLVIRVRAYDLQLPTQTIGKGVQRHTQYNFVPLKIEVFGPGQRLRETRTVPQGWTNDQDFTFQHFDSGSSIEWGQWEVHATNTGPVPAEAKLTVEYVFSRQPLLTRPIPLSLLDQTYVVILDALTPAAELIDNSVLITFGEELTRFFGSAPPAALKPAVFHLPFELKGTGSLKCLEIEASSGKHLLAAMHDRYQKLATSYARQLANASLTLADAAAIRGLIIENDKWKHDWEQKVAPDWITIHVSALFTDVFLDRDFDVVIAGVDVGGVSIDVAEVKKTAVELYLTFDSVFIQCYALILTPAEITGGVADILSSLGVIPELNKLAEEMLTAPLQSAAAPLGRYLGEALGRLCARQGVLIRASADDSAWNVQYTAVPLAGVESAPGHTGAGDIVGGATTGPDGAAGSAGSVQTTVGAASGSTATAPIAGTKLTVSTAAKVTSPGKMPSQLVVGNPEDLKRLDNIETIVVVMMENRSFDHMLGYLPNVNGVKGPWSNPLAGRTSPVLLKKASDVLKPPITQIQLGPEHGFTHVTGRDSITGIPDPSLHGGQIADGAMSGFAQDYENSWPGNGEMVMTYYTGAELKTYDLLASQYGVCDHWFAAHPGPTWPNRWTMYTGSTPELENPRNDDDRLGFLPQLTIFDLLSMHNIDWRIFESDLSLIRTYNQYRLDSTHVIPLRNHHDFSKGFETVALSGKLPPVVFVEPNFSDLPPLTSANDDLVPVDVREGQKFVFWVYDKLLRSPQWSKMLFLVLYDEHGGFFDHVPPPGTKLGPPEFFDTSKGKGRVPRIHPKGADHLGVRVPALVVSPWIRPGTVCSKIFDHTSIIKTILLRHRKQFQGGEFTVFGPRVNQAAHLGMALNLDAGDLIAQRLPRLVPVGEERLPSRPRIRQGISVHDLHESLPHAFLPRPRR